MDFLCLIQARCGSTRLPGKVLLDLEGNTVLGRVIERVKRSKKISEIFVVTTTNIEDLEIVKYCSNNKIRVFCGSADDVLDRFYQIAKLINPKNIIRITADCPLMDPEVIDKVIEQHLTAKASYTSNTQIETYPDGEDVEVFTFESLEKAWKEANLLSEREHVTPYIRKNPDIFKQSSISNDRDLSKMRWTLDNPEDYEFIKIIYKNLYKNNNNFGINDIVDFLENNEDLLKINSNIKRNEGYQKSLNEDNIRS